MSNCPACAQPIPAGAELCPKCGAHGMEGTPRSDPEPRPSIVRTLFKACAAGAFGLLVFSATRAAMRMPVAAPGHEADRCIVCRNNLRQIGLALHNYNNIYLTLPPAMVCDAEGRPMHSWRVLLLPFLDQMGLYRQYRFDEPWDGPNNVRLLSQMPSIYACPSHTGTSGLGGVHTAYVAVFGPEGVFAGEKPGRLSEVTDGIGSTLMVGEVRDVTIPWTKPEDIDLALHAEINRPGGFGSHHERGAHFVITDGTVRFISQNIDPQVLHALTTRNGGEPIVKF